MGNSSSFSNNFLRISVASLIFLEALPGAYAANPDVLKPFPVLGTVTVPEGHWNETPTYLNKLQESVTSEPVKFELEAASGEQYFRLGLLEESRKSFQRLIKAKKPSPSQFMQNMSNLRLAELQLLQGRADECLQMIKGYVNDGNPYIAEEAIFLQARAYLYKRDWNAMNKSVTDLLHKSPGFTDDLALNLLRGVAALEQGHRDVAIAFFKRYPDEPSALYYQAVCFIQNKEISNALPIYQQILQMDPHGEWVDRLRFALGEAFYNAHDMRLAEQFFTPVTRAQADPGLRPMAMHRIACIYFDQKKYTECEKLMPKLLKEFPKHPLRSQWTYLYAAIPIFKKDWRKAITEQKSALENERGLAPQLHGIDAEQLRQTAEFRILWAHLLLNDYIGAKRLADAFIRRYPNAPSTAYAYLAKGLSLYRTAEYDKALEVYQELLNKFPESSASGKAVYLMTLCLHSASDPFRMAGILNEVHARMQTATNKKLDEWTENTLYWVAQAYSQLNDLVNAEKIYQEFISRSPQSPLVPYALEALGSAMSAQGPQRDGEAIIALNQAALRSRDLNDLAFSEQVEVELAKVYYNQRSFAKAASMWEHLVQVSTNTSVRAESLFREADALTRQQYYTEAITKWKALVHIPAFKGSPWVPEALVRIGNTQAGLGQWAEAGSTFSTLKKSYPTTEAGKEASFQLIQCSFNQGDVPSAVNALLDFSKQYPDDARIPKAADNLLSAFHQRKVAVSPAQQAQLLKLAPGSAGGAALLWERGASLFNAGNYEPAQKLFEKIMLSYPNDEYAPLAYFYNADCFFWLQKWDDAANAYQNFFLSFPKHERVPNAMFQKGVCLFRKGAYDDAVTDFEAFLKKYPDHALAKEAWLNIALAYKKAFQLDKSVKAYNYVIQHFEGDPKINAVWLQMGSLLEVQGKRNDAIRVYAKVPASAPEYPEAMYHKSLLYEQAHNPAESRAALEDLRAYPQKKNQYRIAALVKLTEIYEQEGAPAAKLRGLYQDLKASSPDPEIVKQATQRLEELK
jgi:TolA-binding protein